MSGHHVEYDVLADLAEGLLDEQLATSVRAHLEECAECRECSADLVSVSRILASAPLPPMPESLAARLDAVIRAEAESGAQVIDLATRRRIKVQRALAVAAAAVVVSGAGLAVSNGALDVGSESSPAVLLPWGRSPVPVASADRLPRITSATRYQKNTLATQAEEQLKNSRSVKPDTVSDELLHCVKSVAGPAAQVLLVDDAWFGGREATVIMVSRSSGGASVYAVGAPCSGHEHNLLAEARIPG